MPQPQQARSAKTAEKRKALDEKELRHRVRPGIHAKLAELMAWHGIEEQSEAVQLLILNAHALGPEGSSAALALPRHEIHLSENVARRFIEESERELRRDTGD